MVTDAAQKVTSPRWSEDDLLSRRKGLGARAGQLPAQATSRSMLNAKSRRGQREVSAREQHVHESCGSEGKVSSACRQQQRAVVAGTWSALFFLSGLTRREKWLVLLLSAFFSPALSTLSFPGGSPRRPKRRKPACRRQGESMGSTNMTRRAPEDVDKHVLSCLCSCLSTSSVALLALAPVAHVHRQRPYSHTQARSSQTAGGDTRRHLASTRTVIFLCELRHTHAAWASRCACCW